MILSLIFGFILGIFAGSFFFPNLGLILTTVCFGLLIFCYSFFMEKERRLVLFFVAIFFLGAILGLFRMHFSDNYRLSTLSQFENQKTEFVGIVVDEPDVREKAVMLSVLLQGAKIGTTTIPISEKIIISTDLYPRFNYGDQIAFSAKLAVPEKIKSNDREFDYAGYLRVRGVWYTAGFVQPKLISENHGSVVNKYLFQIKKSFVAAMNRAIPPPESDLDRKS